MSTHPPSEFPAGHPNAVDGWRGALVPDPLLDAWHDRVRTAFPGPAGAEVARVFRACLARTVRRSLTPLPHGEVAVITGDIPAMWLRDSSTQMWPYLTLVAEDPEGPLTDVLAGVARRQFALIAHDPYANAFNVFPDGAAHERGDEWGDHPADPLIWERKYEVDSLCFPVQLLTRLVEVTGRRDLIPPSFAAAARAIVATLRREQDHEARSRYRFVRPGGNALDTLSRDGLGSPVARTGMTWSGFRPSDDACVFGFNVPANLHAVAALRDLATLCDLHGEGVWDADGERDDLARHATELAGELEHAVSEHGVVEHPRHGRIWAYEVDGLGGALLMDDANLPSLLSLPLVAGVAQDDPLYLRTRAFVLSEDNPTFTRGPVLTGVGSPHTWPGWVWPMALVAEGMTAGDDAVARGVLETLARTTAGTDHIHESVDATDQTRFTRPWFSWADSMYCLLALAVAVPDEFVHPASSSR